MLPVQRALISVYDKQGLVPFAQALEAIGVEILSTGGTRRHLEEAGVAVTPVSDVTGFPEILDGRVKTLHPAIHGGILADRNRANHLSSLQEHGLGPIDMVVVNLYPFEATAARPDATQKDIVEMIDIGGPTMIRAAAKNWDGVAVVVDPGDYPQIQAALEGASRSVPEPLRRSLALKAFRATQAYDAAIASWLASDSEATEDRLPRRLHIDLDRTHVPRYGENPHQEAAVYRTVGGAGVLGGFTQHQGKTLSWNNLLDADAARSLVALFDRPTVVIVKHNNPCGVGQGATLAEAYERALACDPLSAFGSIIAVNREADRALAEAMANLFVEVVVAPGFHDDAREAYSVRQNLRLLDCPPVRGRGGKTVDLRAIDGGFLAQTADDQDDDPETWTCATERAPSEDEMQGLVLAWRVARAVKSNAIVVANAHQTVGIGAGQMSRVDSCRLATEKAQLPLAGTSAASDAFFPFRDGLEALADAGITAVAQPGGSKRDDEVIAAANERGVAMVMTGRRHFRH